MKYLSALSYVMIILFYSTVSFAMSCEQAISNAKHNGQFMMLDEHTIALLPSDAPAYNFDSTRYCFYLEDFVGPQCDIVSFVMEFRIKGTVAANSIQTYHRIDNRGTLKVKDIFIPVREDVLHKLDQLSRSKKGDFIELYSKWITKISKTKKLSEIVQYPKPGEPCGRPVRSHCGVFNFKQARIDARNIDVQCACDTGAIGNLGTIKASTIRGICTNLNKREPNVDTTCIGVINVFIDGHESCTITADTIVGIGTSAGVVNEVGDTITAETIEGRSYGNQGYAVHLNTGILNRGEIETESAKCCSLYGKDCYRNESGYFDSKKVEGHISAKPQNICPNRQR